ncbi:MAG: hypothetical protein V1674_04725 [Candidatus Omnitrophota bacterium]
MHDLLFKNLSSFDRKKKVLLAFERFNEAGMLTEKQRKFVYIVKEVKNTDAVLEPPQVYVIKNVDTKNQHERFFCKIKASLYALSEKKLFLIQFAQSIRIVLAREDLKSS